MHGKKKMDFQRKEKGTFVDDDTTVFSFSLHLSFFYSLLIFLFPCVVLVSLSLRRQLRNAAIHRGLRKWGKSLNVASSQNVLAAYHYLPMTLFLGEKKTWSGNKKCSQMKRKDVSIIEEKISLPAQLQRSFFFFSKDGSTRNCPEFFCFSFAEICWFFCPTICASNNQILHRKLEEQLSLYG